MLWALAATRAVTATCWLVFRMLHSSDASATPIRSWSAPASINPSDRAAACGWESMTHGWTTMAVPSSSASTCANHTT